LEVAPVAGLTPALFNSLTPIASTVDSAKHRASVAVIGVESALYPTSRPSTYSPRVKFVEVLSLHADSSTMAHNEMSNGSLLSMI